MTTMDLIAACLFATALVHTFAAKSLERLADRFPRHAGLFHLLGEVEVVFGFWAGILIAVMALVAGGKQAIFYVESRQYTEPLFVFVIMVVVASHAPYSKSSDSHSHRRRASCRCEPLSRKYGSGWLQCPCSDRWSPSPLP